MNRRIWTIAFTKQRFLFAPEEEFASKSGTMATFSIVDSDDYDRFVVKREDKAQIPINIYFTPIHFSLFLH